MNDVSTIIIINNFADEAQPWVRSCTILDGHRARERERERVCVCVGWCLCVHVCVHVCVHEGVCVVCVCV